MESEVGVLAALLLGLLLGLKHATDADHVVAVSTIVSEYRNPWRGIWIGASWGLGHTTPLVIVGIAILLLKEMLLQRFETIAPFFEFGVGIMLVILGVQVFWNLKHHRLHVHRHIEESDPHIHIHASHEASSETEVENQHGLFNPGRPFFRLKSYLIGAVHGLAGSAAVMLLLLPQVPNFWVGLGYLVLFGLGTILSMSTITLLLGIPFALTSKSARINQLVAGFAGVGSIVFGIALMSDIALETNFVPF